MNLIYDKTIYISSEIFYCYRTFHTAVNESIDVLYDHMVPVYIRIPDDDEAHAESELFEFKGSFEAGLVWASVDGTHILVIK